MKARVSSICSLFVMMILVSGGFSQTAYANSTADASSSRNTSAARSGTSDSRIEQYFAGANCSAMKCARGEVCVDVMKCTVDGDCYEVGRCFSMPF